MSEMTPIPSGFPEFIIMQILSGFCTLAGILYDLDERGKKAREASDFKHKKLLKVQLYLMFVFLKLRNPAHSSSLSCWIQTKGRQAWKMNGKKEEDRRQGCIYFTAHFCLLLTLWWWNVGAEKKTFVHGLVLGNSVPKTSPRGQQRICTRSVGLRLYW